MRALAFIVEALCKVVPGPVASPLSDFLIKIPMALLPEGREADGYRVEWPSEAGRADSPTLKLFFVVGLIVNFSHTRRELMLNAMMQADSDYVIENRIPDLQREIRAQVEKEYRTLRELLEKDRVELNLENDARRKQLDIQLAKIDRFLSEIKRSTPPRSEDLKKLAELDAARNLERAVLEEFVAIHPIPESFNVAKKFVRALEQRISVFCETKSYHPIYRSEGESGDYNDDYDIHENQSIWRENPFPEEGILLFTVAQKQANPSNGVSIELYALTSGRILQCISEKSEYHHHGIGGWWSDFRSVWRTCLAFSLEDFVARLSSSQKKQLLFALINQQQYLPEGWGPIDVRDQERGENLEG